MILYTDKHVRHTGTTLSLYLSQAEGSTFDTKRCTCAGSLKPAKELSLRGNIHMQRRRRAELRISGLEKPTIRWDTWPPP